MGVSDRRYQVGGTRARGGYTDAKFSRGGCIAFRSVTGTLFVANKDVADLVGRHELVIEGHNRTTGQPEDVLDAEQLEALENGSGAREDGRLGSQLCLALFFRRQLWCLLVQSAHGRITHVFTAFR